MIVIKIGKSAQTPQDLILVIAHQALLEMAKTAQVCLRMCVFYFRKTKFVMRDTGKNLKLVNRMVRASVKHKTILTTNSYKNIMILYLFSSCFRYWWVHKWSAFLPSSCHMFQLWRVLHVLLFSWIPGRWHHAMCRCIHLSRCFVRAVFSGVSKIQKQTSYIPLRQPETVVKQKPKTKLLPDYSGNSIGNRTQQNKKVMVTSHENHLRKKHLIELSYIK